MVGYAGAAVLYGFAPEGSLQDLGHPAFWGFVVLAWAALFAGGLAVQIIARFSNLLDVQWNNQSRSILDNVV